MYYIALLYNNIILIQMLLITYSPLTWGNLSFTTVVAKGSCSHIEELLNSLNKLENDSLTNNPSLVTTSKCITKYLQTSGLINKYMNLPVKLSDCDELLGNCMKFPAGIEPDIL